MQQIEQRAFFRVIGTGWITGCRANPAVFLVDQRVHGKIFRCGIAPQLAPYAKMHELGKRLCETVC
jgi:hypothetical protein